MSEEAQMAEVEKTLLYIAEARQRSEKAARELERGEAQDHLIDALQQSAAELAEIHRRLMQSTFFAVAETQDSLRV